MMLVHFDSGISAPLAATGSVAHHYRDATSTRLLFKRLIRALSEEVFYNILPVCKLTLERQSERERENKDLNLDSQVSRDYTGRVR